MKKKNLYFVIAIITIIAVTVLIIVSNKNSDCKKTDESMCRIKVENTLIQLRVAYSKAAQEKGLMWVTELEENTGMIFVYDDSKPLAFWMKNTLIPLSIAFVETDGRIAKIYDMYPEPKKEETDLTIYPSRTPVRYAIEMPLGWFSINNIKSNSYIKIPKELI
ncbi:MAG: DUF192 domain-containing protein [bacterium]